ncbi:MAG: hypothetical protein AAFQ80_12700 [Cyanobacteria bacterium J06621_8]
MTQPFYFSDGRSANTANDLLELCKQYPDDAATFLVKEDLEKWLAYIGSHDAAKCAATARQTDMGDRQKLEEFLTRCHTLTTETPSPAMVPDTPAVAKQTTLESISTPAESQPEPAVVTASESSNDTAEEDKPSFFQVITRFFLSIFYRGKD